MKLFGLLLCKDEEDLIKYNVSFHRPLLDGLVVIANNPSKKVNNILISLLNKKQINEILYENENDYNQSKWVTNASFYVRDKYNATHCISIDSDEFWAINKEELLDQFKENDILTIPFYNYLPENNKHFTQFIYRTTDKEYSNNKLSLIYSLFSPVNGAYINKFKCAYSLNNLDLVWQGNHFCTLKENNYPVNHMPIYNMKILHFPIRGYQQFKDKIVQGYNAYKNIENKSLGSHWRKLGELLEQNEALFKAEYDKITCKSFDKQQLICDNIIIKDSLEKYL